MKNIRGTLPNILTFMNLSLGVVAILFTASDTNSVNMLIPASLLVMIAALTDRFDGKVARFLGVSSDLGKELDSLSDLISFGVAPVIIAWKICFVGFGIPGYIIALIFPIAGAYRLARFNVMPFNNVFRGIPITIAGSFLTIDNLYNSFAIINGRYSNVHAVFTAFLILLLSYFMISNIKIKKR